MPCQDPQHLGKSYVECPANEADTASCTVIVLLVQTLKAAVDSAAGAAEGQQNSQFKKLILFRLLYDLYLLIHPLPEEAVEAD